MPCGGSTIPIQSAITQWGWSLHTLRGGIDPRDLRFRARFVGAIEIWKDFRSGEGNLSFLGAAGPRRWAEGQLSLRTGYMSLSQSATSQWGWGFHTAVGNIDPEDLFATPLPRRGAVSRRHHTCPTPCASVAGTGMTRQKGVLNRRRTPDIAANTKRACVKYRKQFSCSSSVRWKACRVSTLGMVHHR